MDVLPKIVDTCPELALFDVLTLNQALRLMEKEKTTHLSFVTDNCPEKNAWWIKTHECGKPLRFFWVRYDFDDNMWHASILVKVWNREKCKFEQKEKSHMRRKDARSTVDILKQLEKCTLAIITPDKRQLEEEERIKRICAHPMFGTPRIFSTKVNKDIGPQLLCQVYAKAVRVHKPEAPCQIYACDPPWGGSSACKAYFTYSAPQTLWKKIICKLPRRSRNFYQWLRSNRPCCFYLDVEWVPEKYPHLVEDEVFEAVHRYMAVAFRIFFGVNLEEYPYGMLTATNHTKISRHIWYPTLFFEDNHLSMKRFMEYVVKVKLPYDATHGSPDARMLWHGDTSNPSVLDASVYSRNRVWRILGMCKKTSPDRPLLQQGVSYDDLEANVGEAARIFEDCMLPQPSLEEVLRVIGEEDSCTPMLEGEECSRGSLPRNWRLIRMTEMPHAWGRECGVEENGESRRELMEKKRNTDPDAIMYGNDCLTMDEIDDAYVQLVKDTLQVAELCYNRSSVMVRKMYYVSGDSAIKVEMTGASNGKEEIRNAVNCLSCRKAHYSDNIFMVILLRRKLVKFSCWPKRTNSRTLNHQALKKVIQNNSINHLFHEESDSKRKRSPIPSSTTTPSHEDLPPPHPSLRASAAF